MGCKSSSKASPDGGQTTGTCPANVANTAGSAATLTSGKAVQNKVCFQATSNWYTINVPSGNTLLDVAAGYPAASNTQVDLDVKVYFQTNSTTLTLIQELRADQADGGPDAIQTTLKAAQSGAYYVQVADAKNVSFDATNSYTLTVGYAADPDTHEPNDSPAAAKPSDSKPGYLAYLGDLDVFDASVANAGDLLTLTISNPASAPANVHYQVTSSAGTVLGEGSAPPSAQPLTTLLTAPSAGTYYVTLNSPTGTVPNRTSAAAYSLTFTSVANPDKLNNHTLATAVCPGGGSGPCTMAYSGSAITLPSQTSYIAVPGQRDFYRVDVASGAALVLQISVASSSSSTPVKYAVDLLGSDSNSACKIDADCAAINAPCTGKPSDCELSHACLPAMNYNFCSGSAACQLCEGAGLCIPGASGATGACAVPQYLSAYSGGMPGPDGGLIRGTAGGSTVATAQPLFTAGTYYINVHDATYTNTDLQNPYTLTLQMVPEPDVNDQSTVAANRNNFYDPYPSSMTDYSPDESRAINISAEVTSGQPVTGYISYETDADWFYFYHPCPGEDCALDIELQQPASPVRMGFFMFDKNLTPYASFGYDGTPGTLTGPTTVSFNNQDCTKCSFASKEQTDAGIGGSGSPGPNIYYVRIARAAKMGDPPQDWDFSSTGKYSFTITKGADACPAACSHGTQGCGCYCAEAGGCPSPTF